MPKFLNIHPGEILKEEYLQDLGIPANKLSIATGIPRSNLSSILNGKRNITPDISIRLGRFFNQSPDFWLNIQSMYDLREALHLKKRVFDKISDYTQILKAS